MNIKTKLKFIVHCSNCNEFASCMDELDPEQRFKKMGWKVVNGKTLCPKCAKLSKTRMKANNT
jgi:formylmethanofuran dehydrogenase subunit E